MQHNANYARGKYTSPRKERVLEVKTKEQWIAGYQGTSQLHLQFFLTSAKGLLRNDKECLAECDPGERQFWQVCIDQDVLQIEAIEHILAQEPAAG